MQEAPPAFDITGARPNTTTIVDVCKGLSAMPIDGCSGDLKSSISSTLNNFSEISEDLTEVSANLVDANLKETINGLQSTVSNFDTLLSAIDKGEGSVGKLMKDEGLYNNLEGALGQLQALLEDMKLNPKRYVHFSLFGKKNKPYSQAETETKE